VESKWKNYHITTFPGQSLSKTGLSLEEAVDLSRDRLIENEDRGAMLLVALYSDSYIYEPTVLVYCLLNGDAII
jgi:hypothetical protein